MKNLKAVICQRLPYREWLDENRISIDQLPANQAAITELDQKTLFKNQQLFGFTKEDLKVILAPMIREGKDPIGSMGADTPLGRPFPTFPASG